MMSFTDAIDIRQTDRPAMRYVARATLHRTIRKLTLIQLRRTHTLTYILSLPLSAT